VDRRRFLLTSLAGAVAVPLAVEAQQTGKVYRIGIVAAAPPVSDLSGPDPINPLTRAFVHALRELGYVQGKNLVLDIRSAEGRFDRFPEIVRELVRLKVDVILSSSNELFKASRDVTQTVPMVMVAVGAPVEEGLVQSLARPGGNITGLTLDAGPGLGAKRLELLKEILPKVSRVAVLASKGEQRAPWEQSTQAAAMVLGVRLLVVEHTVSEYADAFALIARERPDALLVPEGTANWQNRRLIVEFAAKSRLPAAYFWRQFADVGGLMSYGVDLPDLYRRAASYTDRILRGANPAEMPVERPSKFELVINLKTAKALGLTIPPSLLARADQVIE
jgi:putative tryptophan/tyrosine transport system substrate-binding protein